MGEDTPAVPSADVEEAMIFRLVREKDVEGIRRYLQDSNVVPIQYDGEGMTPLQHAAYRGGYEICRLLIDHGADVNATKHAHKYSTLHFGVMSGKCDLVRLLLDHGADPTAKNTVGKTASEIGAFVGNHDAVSVINNYVPLSSLDGPFKAKKVTAEVRAAIENPMHDLICTGNVHPVSVINFAEKQISLVVNAKLVGEILEYMMNREMSVDGDANTILAFKLHVLSNYEKLLSTACSSEDKSKHLLALKKKFLTGVEPDGTQEYMEKYLREVIRLFPFVQSPMIVSIVGTLADTKIGDHPTAITLINSHLNGQRMFKNSEPCVACGAESASKKCSKCKSVSYCDAVCQKLEWFTHKRFCQKFLMDRLAAEADKKFTIA
ncbi:unnamed protein product [Notodromas monacha]|uniref:MYND-type domain-containing protein n=1 Tax=Notodromas monacha TaxID=399045 RepID=A0A7R9BJM6_9CRUS|nr:unnamed protein product [Notodromas monacha]CAG0916731.1 unnamed protein product [Notodromas monacha]